MADIMIFRTRQDFRKWLSLNGSHRGIWLIFGKDKSITTLTAPEALEEALCFGWIDGLIQKVDESTYRKYFSPRKRGSRWSDRNKKLVVKLIGLNLMTPRGLEMIEQAKKDGSWEVVQDRTIPEEKYGEFEKLIRKNKVALNNFKKMSQSTRRLFVGFYFEAKKKETRIKRLAKLIDLLEQNKRPM
jgi:uncharacterized protein YdeI (YjbR/CyaY-like superfamily)